MIYFAEYLSSRNYKEDFINLHSSQYNSLIAGYISKEIYNLHTQIFIILRNLKL